MKHLYIILLVFFAGYSCKKEHLKDTIIIDPELAKELRSSPENLTLADNNLTLGTYIWRDFMPESPPNGSKMIAVGKLTDVDQAPIAQSIALGKQYIINKDEIWMADYQEIKNDPAYVLEGVVRNGPEWEAGVQVDVVCEFRYQGEMYRIVAKSQPINATY